jgi:hypothetical protein
VLPEQKKRLDQLKARRQQLKDVAHEAAVNFLWAELDVSDTLASVAETTSNSRTAMHDLINAWVALKSAHEYAERLDLDADERRTFRDMHGALCLRLADLQLRSPN